MKLDIEQIMYLSPEYDEAVKLRDRVLRKPLELEFSTEQLEEEFDQFHFNVYDHRHYLLACLIMKRHNADTIQMRQVAVDPDYQGQGIGRTLVEATEKWARANGYKRIDLHARDIAKTFYQKLNYKIDGDPFIEVNILHYSMYKILKAE